MNKKEKIAALSLLVAMGLLIFSSIYTLEQNKPEDSKFAYEKLLQHIR